MYGFWYSVKEHYSFSSQELKELFFTSLAFAFMLTSYYEGLFQVSNDVHLVLSDKILFFFILSLLVVFIAMYFHIALQKLVGIKLGYNVKYQYWLTLEHIPKLRLGKFRYGTNAKDIARVSLAGPLSHVVIITILGILFFNTDKNPTVLHLITANLLLMIYSMLPVPKLDLPTKIDSASDGLGLFFYSRGVYVLCAATTSAIFSPQPTL